MEWLLLQTLLSLTKDQKINRHSATWTGSIYSNWCLCSLCGLLRLLPGNGQPQGWTLQMQ